MLEQQFCVWFQRWPVRLCALLLVVLALPARAGDLWDSLGPQRVGATREQIAADVPIVCAAAQAVQACSLGPTAPTSFAGLPVERVQLEFTSGRLSLVSLQLHERHHAPLLALLSGRYGQGEDHSFQARAGMSGEFTAGVHIWRQEGTDLVLEQFAGKIDRSRLVYGTEAALVELVREHSARPPGARRDL